MRRRLIGLVLAMLFALSSSSDEATATFSPTVQRVSVSTSGAQANGTTMRAG